LKPWNVVESGAEAGMSQWGLDRLRTINKHENAFRRSLRGGPRAKVPPMVVKPGATAAKAGGGHTARARPRAAQLLGDIGRVGTHAHASTDAPHA